MGGGSDLPPPPPPPPGYNNEDGYWVVKNSWGPESGLGGFMKIAYDAEKTGIASPTDTCAARRCGRRRLLWLRACAAHAPLHSR